MIKFESATAALSRQYNKSRSLVVTNHMIIVAITPTFWRLAWSVIAFGGCGVNRRRILPFLTPRI